MSSSGITLAETRAAFDAVGAGGEPVTAGELAEEMGCSRGAAVEKLTELVGRGEVETKEIAEDRRVWWRPAGDDSQEQRDAESEDGLAADRETDPDLLTRILDASPVGIGVLAPDGTITRVNARAKALLGIDREADADAYAVAAERPVYDADGDPIPPEERPAARAVRSGEPIYNEEVQIETPAGERRWVSMNVEPLFGDDGDVERLVVAGEDVTALKEQARQLERQRDELESELDDVFARIDEAFYALDEEWRFAYLNERAERLLGVSDADAHGRVIWDVLPEARDTEVEAALREATETQEPVTYEEYVAELGAWLEVHAYPSESGLSVHVRDVTDHKRREQELERYETIVETVNDGIYVKDEDDVFTLVNETYAEMLGYEPDELVGRDSSFVVSEDVKQAADELYEALREGDRETVTIEAPMRGAGEEVIEAEASFALIPKADGSGDERVGVVRDITERKERERRLEQQNQRLESFASMLAHELRNPLNIAQLYLQQAAEGEADAFEEVENAHDRMEEMIDVLLILTRGGDSAIDPEPVALREVARESWTALDADAERLTVTTDRIVEAEPHHLRHVLENLFQNALEHGGDDVTVRIGDLESGFYVEDDGPGIPADEREQVFEAGYTTETAGIGLGLTFIAQIAEAYGWEYRLAESESGGARFEFAAAGADPE